MIERTIVELIQKEVDGENSAESSASLRLHLQTDPEARKLFEELRALSTTLSGIEDVEPPPTLKPSVLRAIHRLAAPPKRFSLSFLEKALVFLSPRPAFRYAYVFSAGIAIGLVAFGVISRLVSPSAIKDVDVWGTILTTGAEGTEKTGEKLYIQANQVRGSLSTDYSGSARIVNLDIVSDDDIVAHLYYSPAELSVTGTRQQETYTGTLSVRSGDVEIKSRGSARLSIVFGKRDEQEARVRVSVSASGQIVYDREIILGNQSAG